MTTSNKSIVIITATVTAVILIVVLAVGIGLVFALKPSREHSSKNSTAKTTTPWTIPPLPAIFVFGGYDNGIIVKSILKYCPMAMCSGEGILQNTLSEGGYTGTAGVLGDHIILKFDYDGNNDNFTNKIQLYNYKTGEAKYGPSMPNGLMLQAGATLNGKFYLCGGSDRKGLVYRTCISLDSMLDRWNSDIALMPNFAEAHAMAAVNGGLYVIGGANTNGITKDVWKYNVSSGVWSKVASLSEGSLLSAAVAWRSKIVLCGGAYAITGGAVKLTERCEIYDPDTNKWSDLPSMNVRRRRFSLVNVYDKLFAIGGTGTDGIATTSAEYYDGISWKMTEQPDIVLSLVVEVPG